MPDASSRSAPAGPDTPPQGVAIGHAIRLAEALDVVSDIFCLYDRNFRLVYHNEANKAAMRAAGLDPDAATGRHAYDILPLEGTAAGRESLRALKERVETQWEESYGPNVRLHGRAYPVADGGIMVVARNVTQHWKTEEALRTAATRASALQGVTEAFGRTMTVDEVARVTLTRGLEALGAAAGAVYLLAPDGDTLLATAYEGLPLEAISQWLTVPLESSMLVSDAVRAGRALYLPRREDALETYPSAREANRHVGPDAWTAVPLVHDGRTLGALTLGFQAAVAFDEDGRSFIDAFALQCAQALDRARLYEAERTARAAAEQANRAKADFLTAMSHELRTPLNAIAGYAELLQLGVRGPVTAEQGEDLARIIRNQRHLLGIINDILNFARLDAGQVEFVNAPLGVRELIESVEPLVAPLMKEKAITYSVTGADGLRVVADEEKLRQAMLNLLANAAKFTAIGGRVEVACEAQGGRVRIAVRDTGIGIPADRLDAVFEPFVQVHRSLTQPTAGTGLGLAISRDLVRRMGGEIHLTSTVDVGSVFTIELARG